MLELLLFPMLTCGGLQGKRQWAPEVNQSPRRLHSLHPRCKLQWPQPEIGCWHSSLASMAKVLATQWRNLAVARRHTPKTCRKTSVSTLRSIPNTEEHALMAMIIGTFNRLNPAHQRPTPILLNRRFTQDACATEEHVAEKHQKPCWHGRLTFLSWQLAQQAAYTLSSAYSVAANHSKSGFKVGD